MAEGVTVNGGKSAVEIAYALTADIAEAEGRKYVGGQFKNDADRKYILDTFAECLKAARGGRSSPQTNN